MLECLVAWHLHLVKTNSSPLTSDSSTFPYTRNVNRNSTCLIVASLTHTGSNGAPSDSSQNFSTCCVSHVRRSCPVTPGSNALMLSSPSSCSCFLQPLSAAVISSPSLSPVLCSLQRFPVCATSDNSSAMHRKFVYHPMKLRTYTHTVWPQRLNPSQLFQFSRAHTSSFVSKSWINW